MRGQKRKIWKTDFHQVVERGMKIMATTTNTLTKDSSAAKTQSHAVVGGPAHAPEEMRGARILCEALVREGVDTIFGYPGGAVLHIYDELARTEHNLKHILCRHEQGAVHNSAGSDHRPSAKKDDRH